MTPETITLFLSIMATYRFSRMIVGESGPFNIFSNIRGSIMKKYGPNHWLYSGINCPLCVSFWIAGITAVYTTPTPALFPLHWLGIAGAVVTVYRRLD